MELNTDRNQHRLLRPRRGPIRSLLHRVFGRSFELDSRAVIRLLEANGWESWFRYEKGAKHRA